MLPTKQQGAKKRFIKRDNSKDDEPIENKEYLPANSTSQSTQPALRLHHNQQPNTIPQDQQSYRRQPTTPQQQRRHLIRSPSLNSPRTDRRSVLSSLSPLHSVDFTHDIRPSPVQTEVVSTRAPRSPRPLQRASTERSSSTHPISSCHTTTQIEHPQRTSIHRREIEQHVPTNMYCDHAPSQGDTPSQNHNEVNRRHSNEPYQATLPKQFNRASAESDTSFNRLHASIICSPPPLDTWKTSSNFNQQVMDRTTDGYQHNAQQWADPSMYWQEINRFEHLPQPQISRYTGKSPTHHRSPGFPSQLGSYPRYSSPCNLSDGSKTRSSSLTDSTPSVQSPLAVLHQSTDIDKIPFKIALHQQKYQNQSFDNDRVIERPLYRSRISLDDEKISEKNAQSAEFPDTTQVFMRPKTDKNDSDGKNRRSFYDNDTFSEQFKQFEDGKETPEMFANPGNTWKSQTAPAPFSIFKRPVYGRITQVVPPHLAGVFDPKKFLQRSNSKPIGSTSKERSVLGNQRNRASDSSFRYSDPVSQYDIVERNFSDQIIKKENETGETSADPKHLNQFLSLYSGPWSKENSLFGRANVAKETKKVETNWKKYEEYQNPYPSKVFAKGKTQKELNEHVELMEKLKHNKSESAERTSQGDTSQRTSLSRSHESIESSQATPPKPREKFIASAATKSRSQELPIDKKGLLDGNVKLKSLKDRGLSFHPYQGLPILDQNEPSSHKPTTCVSIKQLTLSLPDHEIVASSPTFEQLSNGQPCNANKPKSMHQDTNDAESTKLHTSKLNFQPSSSMSPRMLRKEVQTSERKPSDIRGQRSSDPGSEPSISIKGDKYITCITIPESELNFDEQNVPQEEITDSKTTVAMNSHYPSAQATPFNASSKPRARRTESDTTNINNLPAQPITGVPRSAGYRPNQLPTETRFFTFPDKTITPTISTGESETTKSTNLAVNSQPARESQVYKLSNLHEEFLNDNFSYSEQEQQSPQNEQLPHDFRKPKQSSELSISDSSSSLSLGESSFAAFCLQHQADKAINKPVSESDEAKTPTNVDQAPVQAISNHLKETTAELTSPSTTNPPSAKKLQHSLSKQDSFNSPDSPLFHKTLPLPKDSVILHHRRHYLKECVSLQSSSSSSEESDLENFSALRLTPRRPRRNKQRNVV